METSLKNNHIRSAGGVPGKFQSAFQRLRPGIAEKESIQAGWNHGTQFFHQLQHRFMGHQVCLPVQQQTGLLADRFHHFGMAMTCVGYSNSAGEIKDPTPVGGVNITSFSVVDNNICVMCPNRRKVFEVR